MRVRPKDLTAISIKVVSSECTYAYKSESNRKGNAVVQDTQKVGTALKTLSLRLTKTKAQLEDMGADSEGAATSISQLRDKILALSNQKVDILDGDAYKSTTQVMRELVAEWDNISQINQQGILQLIGGVNQANVLTSIIKNWDDVEAAIESASNATGSAEKEQQVYLDSIEGRLEQFKSTVQSLSSHFIDADIFKGFISAGTGIVDVLDKMAQSGTLLPTILAGVAAALSRIKNIGIFQLTDKGVLGSTYKGASKNGVMQTIANQYDLFGTGKTWNEMRTARQYKQVLKGFDITSDVSKDIAYLDKYNSKLIELRNTGTESGEAVSKAMEFAQQGLSEGEIPQRAKAIVEGMTGIGEAAKEAGGQINALAIDTGAFEKISTGTSKAADGLKRLGSMALNAVASFGISLGIEALFQGIDYVIHYNENKISEGMAVVDAYKEALNEYNKNLEDIESIRSEFDTLSLGVDDLGRNVSLNTDEYARYQQIIEGLTTAYPSLIASYDAEGKALANKNGLLERAIELEEKQMDQARRERVSNMKTELEGYKAAVQEAYNDMAYAETGRPESLKWFGAFSANLDELFANWRGETNLASLERVKEVLAGVEAEIVRINETGDPFGADKDTLDSLYKRRDAYLSYIDAVEQGNTAMGDSLNTYMQGLDKYDKLTDAQRDFAAQVTQNLANVITGDTGRTIEDAERQIRKLVNTVDDIDLSFMDDLNKLKAGFADGTIGAEEFAGGLDDIVAKVTDIFSKAKLTNGEGNPITEEDVREMLGIDAIKAESDNLKTAFDEIKNTYKDGVNFTGLDTVGQQRALTKYTELLERFYSSQDKPLSANVLQGVVNALNGPDLEAATQDLQRMFDVLNDTQMDTAQFEAFWNSIVGQGFGNIDEAITGLEMFNEAVNAAGISAEEAKGYWDSFLANPAIATTFATLSSQFNSGAISAQEYDMALQGILQTMLGFDASQIEQAMTVMGKALDPDALGQSLKAAQEGIRDLQNMPAVNRVVNSSALTDELDGLNQALSQAVASKDVSAYYEIAAAITQVETAASLATDPIGQMSSVFEIASNAVSEFYSTGSLSSETFLKLSALGQDFASTMQVTSQGIGLNVSALSELTTAHSKETIAQLQALQSQQQLTTAHYQSAAAALEEKAALEGLTAEEEAELNALYGLISMGQQMNGVYAGMISSIEAVTGAHAQMMAAMNGGSPSDPFEETMSAVKRAEELIAENRIPQAWEILTHLSPGGLPKTTEAVTEFAKAMHQLYGSDSVLENVSAIMQKAVDLDASGAFANMASSFKTNLQGEVEFNIASWELEDIASKIGIQAEELQYALDTMGAYSFSVDAEFTLEGDLKVLESFGAIERQVNETGESIVVNWDKMRDYIAKGDFDTDQLKQIYDALLSLEGVDLSTLETQLGGTLSELGTDFDYAREKANQLKETIPELDGMTISAEGLNTMDLSQFISQCKAAGDTAEETAAKVQAAAKDGNVTFTFKGEATSLENAVAIAGDAKDRWEDVRAALDETVHITGKVDIEGLQTLAGSKEKLQEWKRLAEDTNDTTVVTNIDMAIDTFDTSEVANSIQGVKDQITQTQDELTRLRNFTFDGVDWGLPGAAQAVYDAVSGIVEEIITTLETINGVSLSIDAGAAIAACSNLASAAHSAKSAVDALKASASSIPSSVATSKGTKSAKGTKSSAGGPTLVNDGVPVNGSSAELIIKKNSDEVFIANGGRMAMVDLDPGDQVLNAADTQKVLHPATGASRFKRLASGTWNLKTGHTSTTTTTTSKTTTSTHASSSGGKKSSSSGTVTQQKNQAAQEAKEVTSAATEASLDEFEKYYDELKYLRDMDVINEEEYYNRLSSLRTQYLANSEDEDTVKKDRQIEVEVYKGQKSVYKDNFDKELKDIQYARDKDLISAEEYYRNLEQLNKRYFEGRDDYLTEWRQYDVEVYNGQKEVYSQAVSGMFSDLDHQRDLDLISEEEYVKKKIALNEEYNKNRIDRAEEYRDTEVAIYNSLKELYSGRFDHDYAAYEKWEKYSIQTTEQILKGYFSTMSQANDLVVAAQKDLDTAVAKGASKEELQMARAKLDSANKEFETARDNYYDAQLEAAEARLEKANQWVISFFEDKIKDLESQRDAELKPYEQKQKQLTKKRDAIQKQIDKNNREVELKLRPIDDETWDINRKVEDIEDYYAELLKPYEDEQKALQKEQSRLQREQELKLRPIEKELTALNKEMNRINKTYSKMLKPYQRMQKSLQREISKYQREEDLTLRPIEKELRAISRESTHVTRAFKAQIDPLKKQLEALQDAKDAEKEQLEIEEARYKLAKAMTERSSLVYVSGRGFVYKANAEDVREAEKALREKLEDKQIEELQKRIDELEKAQDKILEDLDDRQYELNESKLDIEEMFDDLLEPLQDELYDLGLLIDQIQDMWDETIEPLEDRRDILQDQQDAIKEYYESLLDPIADRLYDINDIIEEMQETRDALLEPFEKRLKELKRLEEEINHTLTLTNRPLEDEVYELDSKLDEIDEEIESIEEKYNRMLDDLNQGLDAWNNNIFNATERANQEAAAIALFGEKFVNTMQELGEHSIPTATKALAILGKKYAEISGNLLAGITPNDLLGVGNYNNVHNAEGINYATNGDTEARGDWFAKKTNSVAPIVFLVALKKALAAGYFGTDESQITEELTTKIAQLMNAQAVGDEKATEEIESFITQYAPLLVEKGFLSASAESVKVEKEQAADVKDIGQSVDAGNKQNNQNDQKAYRQDTATQTGVFKLNDQADVVSVQINEANDQRAEEADRLDGTQQEIISSTYAMSEQLDEANALRAEEASRSDAYDESKLEALQNELNYLKEIFEVLVQQSDLSAREQEILQSYLDNMKQAVTDSITQSTVHNAAVGNNLTQTIQDALGSVIGNNGTIGGNTTINNTVVNVPDSQPSANTSSGMSQSMLNQLGANTNKPASSSGSVSMAQSILNQLTPENTTGANASSTVKPTTPASTTSTKPDIVFLTRFLKALNNGEKGVQGAPISQIVANHIAKLLNGTDDGSKAALQALFDIYDPMLKAKGYASGRLAGPAELAITQEAGPEAIFNNKSGKYTLLSPGDMVFTHAQTKALWDLSLKMNELDLEKNLRTGSLSDKINALCSKTDNVVINVGDVIVQHAEDEQALSEAIINRLPNQLLQDMRKR